MSGDMLELCVHVNSNETAEQNTSENEDAIFERDVVSGVSMYSSAASSSPIPSSPAPLSQAMHLNTTPLSQPMHLNTTPSSQPMHLNTTPSSQPMHLNTTPSSQPMHLNTTASSQPMHLNTTPSSQPIHLNTTPSSQPMHLNTTPSSQPMHLNTTPSSHVIHLNPSPSSHAMHLDSAVSSQTMSSPVLQFVQQTEVTPFQKRVLTLLESISTKVSQNENTLRSILLDNSNHVSAVDDSARLFELPLKDASDVKSFEDYLNDPLNFNKMVKYLQTKGGIDFPHVTRRILQSLMTSEVASTYNWAGRGEKIPFKTTNRKKLVFYVNNEIYSKVEGAKFKMVLKSVVIAVFKMNSRWC